MPSEIWHVYSRLVQSAGHDFWWSGNYVTNARAAYSAGEMEGIELLV